MSSELLRIDEKWSVEYDPSNNDKPGRILRYGEPVFGGSSDWKNDALAMFYALIDRDARIEALEAENARLRDDRNRYERKICAAEHGHTINDVLANYRQIRRDIQDRRAREGGNADGFEGDVEGWSPVDTAIVVMRRNRNAERLTGARVVPDEMVKSITDFIREDVLPSYGIESEVGRNDPELFSAVRTALSALAKPAGEVHPDDLAVDRFAAAMKAKLAKKRNEGRGGWDSREECTAEHLSYLLIQHCLKGDPLDVGNLAMMLHQRGDRIVIDDETASIMRRPEPAGEAEPVADEDEREDRIAALPYPDEAPTPEVLSYVLSCARLWVPEARIIGNARAGDIVRALSTPPDASAIREALPVTGPYVDRLIRIFQNRPDDDTSAVVLQDYARATLAGAKP